MVDSKTKFILIQISPLIVLLAFIVLNLVGVLIFRKKARPFIDFLNSMFWNYDYCFINCKSDGKVLGKCLFIEKESTKIVSRHLFSSIIAAAGPIAAV